MKNFFKTKIFPLLVCAVIALACAGCNFGSYSDVGGKPNESGSGQTGPGGEGGHGSKPPEGGDEPEINLNYTVTLFVDSAPYDFGENDMKVEWVNQKNTRKRYSAAVNSKGVANAGVLEDGDYNVHILGLPEKFTYNPNAKENVAHPDMRQIYLNLSYPVKPASGDGTGWISQAYKFVALGIYRAVIDSPGQEVHYAFTPTPVQGEEGGYYAIRSVCDTYIDEVNPTFRQYNGNNGGWMGGVLDTRTKGGPEGSYTQNFVFSIPITEKYVGNTIFFTVTAEQKFDDYPVTVDFLVAREGDAVEDEEALIIPAAQAKGKAADSNLTYHYADAASSYYRTFDHTQFKFNSRTGYYHRYDAELYKSNPLGFGAGFGPILYCDIQKAPPSFPQYPLISANQNSLGTMGTPRPLLTLVAEFMGVEYNESKYDEDYGRSTTSIFEQYLEQNKKWNFEPFIAQYAATMNNHGRVYVTKELKIFLQLYAENLWLWSDNVYKGMQNYTTPEDKGYSASQDSLWLYACGWYE